MFLNSTHLEAFPESLGDGRIPCRATLDGDTSAGSRSALHGGQEGNLFLLQLSYFTKQRVEAFPKYGGEREEGMGIGRGTLRLKTKNRNRACTEREGTIKERKKKKEKMSYVVDRISPWC